MNRKKYMFILVIVFTFVLAACSSNDMDKNDGNQTTDNQQNTQENNQGNQDTSETGDNQTGNKNEATTNTELKVTPTDAYDQYVKEFPDTKVEKIHLDQNKGSYIYEVKGFDDTKEYKIKINPMNGEIVETESEVDDDEHKEIPKDSLINVLTLVDEALTDAGENPILDEWEVDYDNDVLVLEVEIELASGDDVSYKYNLETDELIKKDS